jgi:hypothetical protein
MRLRILLSSLNSADSAYAELEQLVANQLGDSSP